MFPKDFVTKYLPYAKKSEQETGISAIASLTQAALESGWGEKTSGNYNFFGIKASPNTPDDHKMLVTTTEYLKSPNVKFPSILSIEKQKNGTYKYKVKDWFMSYQSPDEAFTQHAQFFLKNPRYSKALEVKSDYNKFFEEIAAAGYATAEGYADTLKAVAKTIVKNVPTGN